MILESNKELEELLAKSEALAKERNQLETKIRQLREQELEARRQWAETLVGKLTPEQCEDLATVLASHGHCMTL